MVVNIPSVSWNEVSNEWILLTAAGITLFSLFQAWLASFIIYGEVKALKKVFPATHNLIRSHIDYLMMASLLGTVYFSCLFLSVRLPAVVVVLICLGAIYNPLGFMFKAVSPSIGHDGSRKTKVGVLAGFLPATIGFGYSMAAIIMALLG
ncbi:MAG: hypothetical protein HRU11_02650 [Parvularculaceae bacterium]|nr:hypothetical protein [Parvularculaceae bacterium]